MAQRIPPPPESSTQAESQTTDALKAGMDINDPLLPRMRWDALLAVESAKTVHGKNPLGADLLRAIFICARHALPMPDWVAQAYIQAWESWRTGEAEDLHAAFGVPRLTSRARKAAKLRLKWMVPILNAVNERHERGEPIDEGLFQGVAADFSLKPATLRNYYYKALDIARAGPMGALFHPKRHLGGNTKRQK